jgi:pyruvate carboxylase
MQGLIGQPPGGFPEPLRSRILKDKKVYTGRPGADRAQMPSLEFDKVKTELIEKYGQTVRECDVMSYVMFP